MNHLSVPHEGGGQGAPSTAAAGAALVSGHHHFLTNLQETDKTDTSGR